MVAWRKHAGGAMSANIRALPVVWNDDGTPGFVSPR
jgi:hypothetical protein